MSNNVSSLLAPATPVAALSDVRTMLHDSVKAIAVRDAHRKRVAAYVGGSLAVHLGVWAILGSMPVEDSNVSLVLTNSEATSTSSFSTTTEETPVEPDQEITGADTGEAGAGSTAMTLPEGAAGKPDTKTDGSMKIAKTHTDPAIARQQAIEYARSAGFMGDTRSISSAISSIAGDADYSSGFDTASFYGPLIGGHGDGRGSFGMGRDGFGPGGGCYGGNCGTVPGSSKYNTIGNGPGAGDGPYGPGTGGGGLRKRVAQVPNPIGQPSAVSDGLDRAIIKRYVKQSTTKISYCYEHELLARSDLQGTVVVSFLITPSGTVQVSTGSGMDATVASCVANVVKNIQFPAPKNGGNVQVNYPFSFRRAG